MIWYPLQKSIAHKPASERAGASFLPLSGRPWHTMLMAKDLSRATQGNLDLVLAPLGTCMRPRLRMGKYQPFTTGCYSKGGDGPLIPHPRRGTRWSLPEGGSNPHPLDASHELIFSREFLSLEPAPYVRRSGEQISRQGGFEQAPSHSLRGGSTEQSLDAVRGATPLSGNHQSTNQGVHP